MPMEVERIEALVAEACDLTEQAATRGAGEPSVLAAIGALRLELLAATADLFDAGLLDDAYGAVLGLDETVRRLAQGTDGADAPPDGRVLVSA
jgi:hypothetical protein